MDIVVLLLWKVLFSANVNYNHFPSHVSASENLSRSPAKYFNYHLRPVLATDEQIEIIKWMFNYRSDELLYCANVTSYDVWSPQTSTFVLVRHSSWWSSFDCLIIVIQHYIHFQLYMILSSWMWLYYTLSYCTHTWQSFSLSSS